MLGLGNRCWLFKRVSCNVFFAILKTKCCCLSIKAELPLTEIGNISMSNEDYSHKCHFDSLACPFSEHLRHRRTCLVRICVQMAAGLPLPLCQPEYKRNEKQTVAQDSDYRLFSWQVLSLWNSVKQRSSPVRERYLCWLAAWKALLRIKDNSDERIYYRLSFLNLFVFI